MYSSHRNVTIDMIFFLFFQVLVVSCYFIRQAINSPRWYKNIRKQFHGRRGANDGVEQGSSSPYPALALHARRSTVSPSEAFV